MRRAKQWTFCCPACGRVHATERACDTLTGRALLAYAGLVVSVIFVLHSLMVLADWILGP